MGSEYYHQSQLITLHLSLEKEGKILKIEKKNCRTTDYIT